MEVTVLNNQTVFDLAIRYCGSPLAAFQIANANAIPVTKKLSAGSKIMIPSIDNTDNNVVDHYRGTYHQPATAWDEKRTAIPPKLEGISYWAIGIDFVVSNSLHAEKEDL
ncbi:MAG TPA: hypothetical protein VL022_04890 [Moheibacter sp.]|nr:hypothetical protein [Moheibacter sp.]